MQRKLNWDQPINQRIISALMVALMAMPLSGHAQEASVAIPEEPIPAEQVVAPPQAEARPAKAPSDSEQFMRIRKDPEGQQVALETSITRFEKRDEDGNRITVDLIGVVHIGEQDYYRQLNRRFKQYEGVLFELVAPEGTVIPKGGRKDEGGLNPVAGLQKGLQSVLGLEFQLDHIDYTMKNFIHADMTPEEFAQSMKKNGESISKYIFRAIGQSMAMQGKGGGELGILQALLSDNREIEMRRAFADQMQNLEAGLVMFQGDNGSTIIDHRNAKCMAVLKRELESGKKNLAIFYGAGHLPDMQDRLQDDFSMTRAGQKWLTAWSLQVPHDSR